MTLKEEFWRNEQGREKTMRTWRRSELSQTQQKIDGAVQSYGNNSNTARRYKRDGDWGLGAQ